MNDNRNKDDFTSVNAPAVVMTANNEPSGNPSALGVLDRDENEDVKALHPRHPDSRVGYQPLSKFLVKKYVKMIDNILHQICTERGTSLDFSYWKNITRQLFSAPDASTAQIVPAKAGYGKSTWLLALMVFFRKLEVESPEEACSLGGCCVVLQKVETLNALADQLEHYADSLKLGSGTEMVMIQGWSQSGVAHGFCQNSDVNSFKECQKKACPFANSCKMLRFTEEARHASLIGITQKRFDLLRSGGDLSSILIRELNDGTEVHRRFLIFDEKFDLAEVHDLNRNTLVKATAELEALIQKRKCSESVVQTVENGLDYSIRLPFQNLRREKTSGRLNGDTLESVIPPKVGFCTATDLEKYVYCRETARKFSNLKKDISERYHKCLTSSVQECIRVWDDLLNKDVEILYTVDQGFTLHDISPASLDFGNVLTVVFDATADVDPDYLNLSNVNFLRSQMEKPDEEIFFQIYTDDAYRVSKSAFQSNWKLPIICRKVAEILLENEGEFFISTYQRYAGAIYNELEKLLDADDLKRIATIKNRDRQNILPYFGGTNGENSFNHCKHVILIGYPRLPPATYLTNTCAVFGPDAVRTEIDKFSADGLYDERKESTEMPSVKEYIRGHLTARLEQEIYRCQIRNFDYKGGTKIYLFCPPADVLDMLLKRFPAAERIDFQETPNNLETVKRGSRSFLGSSTAFKRLIEFIQSWDGKPIRVSAIKETLKISESIWHDIIRSPEWKAYMNNRNIIVSGNGRNRKWEKDPNNAAA